MRLPSRGTSVCRPGSDPADPPRGVGAVRGCGAPTSRATTATAGSRLEARGRRAHAEDQDVRRGCAEVSTDTGGTGARTAEVPSNAGRTFGSKEMVTGPSPSATLAG